MIVYVVVLKVMVVYLYTYYKSIIGGNALLDVVTVPPTLNCNLILWRRHISKRRAILA